MKILVICNKSPFPPSEGGPMAMNAIINGLLEAGHQVRVLAVNSEKYHININDIPQEYREKTKIEFVDLDLRVKISGALRCLLKGKSYHVERFISEAFRQKLIEILKEEQFDIVQLEMIFMAPYIETIRQNSNAIIVLRAHNVEHLIWDRIAKKTSFWPKKWYIQHLTHALSRYERRVIKDVDGIAAITYRDAMFFRGITSTPVIDIPFGIDTNDFTPSFAVKEKPTFFHIGSMNWMPNEEAISWLLHDIWPTVVSRLPEAQLHLAGRNMPKWLLRRHFPNVIIDGEVPDAKEFVASHDIAIVPLISGSGMRIKIIEAMAMGKTVITTMVGAEGIQYEEYKNIIIGNNADQIAEMMIKAYQNSQNCQEIGKNARQLIENQYDNKKIIQRLLLFYNEIINRKK